MSEGEDKPQKPRSLTEDSFVYDEWYKKRGGIVEPEIPTLVELLKAKQHPRALDVGCGLGRHALYLAKEGIETYGFDISRRAIEQANRLAAEAGLRVNLSIGDMFQRFPFGKGYFQAVIITKTIHHGYAKQVYGAIGEIDRVTQRGGYIFLQVPKWPPNEEAKNQRATRVEPTTLIWSTGEDAGIPHYHFTKAKLLNLFRNFEILELHSESNHYHGWCLLARKNA